MLRLFHKWTMVGFSRPLNAEAIELRRYIMAGGHRMQAWPYSGNYYTNDWSATPYSCVFIWSCSTSERRLQWEYWSAFGGHEHSAMRHRRALLGRRFWRAGRRTLFGWQASDMTACLIYGIEIDAEPLKSVWKVDSANATYQCRYGASRAFRIVKKLEAAYYKVKSKLLIHRYKEEARDKFFSACSSRFACLVASAIHSKRQSRILKQCISDVSSRYYRRSHFVMMSAFPWHFPADFRENKADGSNIPVVRIVHR